MSTKLRHPWEAAVVLACGLERNPKGKRGLHVAAIGCGAERK